MLQFLFVWNSGSHGVAAKTLTVVAVIWKAHLGWRIVSSKAHWLWARGLRTLSCVFSKLDNWLPLN